MFKQAPCLSTSFTVTEDGFPVGNRPQYSDAEREFTKVLIPSGGVPLNPSDNLEVTAAGGMDVSVAVGVIIKNGVRCYLDTAKNITLTTSASDQTIYIGIRMAAGDTHVDGDDVLAYTTYVQATDCPVARIVVPANATTITSGMITDLRGNPAYCPYANDLITQAEAAIAALNENGVPLHASTHEAGGDDEIDIDACSGVQYIAQTLTSDEKAQVRTNIGVGSVIDTLASTSATDSLSANMGKNLDNIKQSAWTLLWTNSSPSSTFAGQKISLTLTDYDAVVIGFYGLNDLASGVQYQLFAQGATAYAMVPWVYIRVRTVAVATDGVTFGGGQRFTTYGTATLSDNDAWVIPYKIYGIKHLFVD